MLFARESMPLLRLRRVSARRTSPAPIVIAWEDEPGRWNPSIRPSFNHSQRATPADAKVFLLQFVYMMYTFYI